MQYEHACVSNWLEPVMLMIAGELASHDVAGGNVQTWWYLKCQSKLDCNNILDDDAVPR